jgi:hypothetical protein
MVAYVSQTQPLTQAAEHGGRFDLEHTRGSKPGEPLWYLVLSVFVTSVSHLLAVSLLVVQIIVRLTPCVVFAGTPRDLFFSVFKCFSFTFERFFLPCFCCVTGSSRRALPKLIQQFSSRGPLPISGGVPDGGEVRNPPPSPSPHPRHPFHQKRNPGQRLPIFQV